MLCTMPSPNPDEPTTPHHSVVLDTNIVLDLWVFADVAALPLRSAIEGGHIEWVATQPMRNELVRVLGYPQIVKRLQHAQVTAESVVCKFEAWAKLQPMPAKAIFTCKDPDDQKFIDLAVAHKALLLSKDVAVLCMARRLKTLGATAQSAFA